MASNGGEFEPFREDLVAAYEGDPAIRIDVPSAYLNKPAFVQLFEKCDRAGVYVDWDYSRLGFDPGDADAPYAVTLSGKSGGATVSIGTVMAMFGLDETTVTESHKLPIEEDRDSGLVVVDLADMVQAYVDDAWLCPECGRRFDTQEGRNAHAGSAHPSGVHADDLEDPDIGPEDVGLSPIGERAGGDGDGG